MADFLRKAVAPQFSRKRRLVVVLLLLVPLATLFIEHWRGERALRAWKNEMAARGEIFDPNKLWPAPDPFSGAFPYALAEAVERLPKSLTLAGSLSGLSHDESGRPSRGSQQAQPPFSYPQDPTTNASTWPEFETASREAQPALEAIRNLMKNPPRTMGVAIAKRLDGDGFPYPFNIRRSSQALHKAVIVDLHQGNLDAALENLEALQGCVGLCADDPSLTHYMMRVALVGLGSDAGWDALQEDRWTEAQLLRLQKAYQANVLFPQMPNTLMADRLEHLHSMDWFASHSYQAWIDRYSDIHKSFGSKAAELDTANWNGVWRRWIFHPTWSYAWRAQEELHWLQFAQRDLDIVREGVKRESWVYLKERQTEWRRSYRRPSADWRFYRILPLYDSLHEIVGGQRREQPACPYPDFSRAWFATAKNLTRHAMVTTVISLQRHQRREGRMPNDLAALVPGYLQALPRDLMDGQPLRYRLNPDGSFKLYSVGEDGRDDGGDARPAESSATPQALDSWSGRDWVWPQASAAGKRTKT